MGPSDHRTVRREWPAAGRDWLPGDSLLSFLCPGSGGFQRKGGLAGSQPFRELAQLFRAFMQADGVRSILFEMPGEVGLPSWCWFMSGPVGARN
jgi:hypothetical protein